MAKRLFIVAIPVAMLSLAIEVANMSTALALPNQPRAVPQDPYDRVIRMTMERREKEGVPGSERTPQHIVDEVVAAEQDRPVTRDSGERYGVNPGENELRACATHPIDCTRAKSAIQDAERISSERFPGANNDTIQDADRHCIWQALTTIRSSADFARHIGDAHEADHPGTPEATDMDQTNNKTGRDVGLRHENDESGAIDECHDLAEHGHLTVIAQGG